jgi:DNA primase
MSNKFDVKQINSISIFRVAERIGIEINRGKKATCFLHDEKTPSMSFNIRSNSWYCFGCGKHGTVIDLVMAAYSLEFIESCQWLCNEFGIAVTQTRFASRSIKHKIVKTSVLNPKVVKEERLPDTDVYEWIFQNSTLSESGKKYLEKSRGFNEATITHFHLKDIVYPFQFYIELKRRWGFERLLKAGLARANDNGEERFIWWGHTLLIPYINEEGKIVSIQGRMIDGSGYKYLNLRGIKTEIFNSTLLKQLRAGERVCICEGAMDTMMAYQNGINAVGISGATSFKKEWIERFDHLLVFVVPDNDMAGQNFAMRITAFFDEIGKSIQIINLPPQVKDLSDHFFKPPSYVEQNS